LNAVLFETTISPNGGGRRGQDFNAVTESVVLWSSTHLPYWLWFISQC